MLVKLSNYNLHSWQSSENIITPRLMVCASNSAKKLGVVVDMQEPIQRYPNAQDCVWGSLRYVKRVEVLWLTGTKKGQRELKLTENLVNYEAYKREIAKQLSKLEEVEKEAAQTGL